MFMKDKFPGCNNISLQEGILFVKILSEDDDMTADKVKSFLNGIDDALHIQKMKSVFNKFKGKRISRQNANDIIYERICKIEM